MEMTSCGNPRNLVISAPDNKPARAPPTAPITSSANGSVRPAMQALPAAYAPIPNNAACPSVATPQYPVTRSSESTRNAIPTSRVKNARSSGNRKYPVAPSAAIATTPINSGESDGLAVDRSIVVMGMSISMYPSEQAVREQKDDQDNRQIEEKLAEFRREIFSGGIGQSEQQRSGQGP